MKTIYFIICFLILSAFSDDPKVCYVVVSQDFKDRFEYYQRGVNILKTSTDTAGHILVSCNALNEFPELFDTMQNIQFIWLAPGAFPVDSTDWE